jgi:hypothetical protein
MTFELPTTSHVPRAPQLVLVEPPPRKRPATTRRWVLLTALVGILAVLATGIGVYRWQHAKVTGVAIDGTTVAQLRAQLSDRDRQISSLYGRLLIHGQQIERLKARIEGLQARNQDAMALQAQLGKARADLAAAQKELTTMVGSPLADGTYKGVLYAADDADVPPRIAMFVIDDVQGNALSDRGWRVLEVAPDLQVRLTSPPRGPATVDFEVFVEMWNNGDAEAADLHGVVYSITVADDLVIELLETGEPTHGG